MTRTEQIFDYIQANPGVTNNAISKAIDYPTSNVAVVTTTMWKKGLLRREVDGSTLTGVARYAYFTNAACDSKPLEIASTHKQSKVSKAAPSLDAAVTGFVDQFVDTLASTIISQIKSRLEERIAAALPAALPQPPRKPEPIVVQSKLPRVAVTGMLPQQAGMLQQEFCDTLDIAFWNDRNGDGLGSLKALANREAVFIHVNHASHSTEETLLRHGARIIRVGGGLTSMRDALTKFYVEEVTA